MSRVRADSIREGDRFVNQDGNVVWTAIEDARVGSHEIAINVQHHPDGGLETRHFDRDTEWSSGLVKRAPR